MNDELTKDDLNAVFGEDVKWKEVDTSGSGESWKPAKGDSLMGVFTKTKQVTTKYGLRTLYVIEKPDHTSIDVWESAQIRRGFQNVSIGDQVKITYLGKDLTEKGQPINKFKFFHEEK